VLAFAHAGQAVSYDYNSDYNYDYNTDYNYDYNTDYNYDYNSDSSAGVAAAGLGIVFIIIAMIGGLIGLLLFVFEIWMVIDCAKRTFDNKTLWMVILIAGFFFGFGPIAAIIYFFVIKRKNIGGKPAGVVQK
jgi:hypothetical protein